MLASRTPVPARHTGSGTSARSLIGVLVLVFWCLVALAPVFVTLISVFKTNEDIRASPLAFPTDVDFGGFVRAWEGTDFGEPAWRYGVNSVVAVSIGVAVGMAVSAPAAYALARNARSFSLLNRYFVLLMVVPVVVTWIALFKLASSLDLLSSPVKLGFIYAAFVTPIAIILLRAHFSSFPADLIDAAKVDGASEARAFASIFLPMSAKSLTVVAMLQAIFLWNELGVALILQLHSESRTLPVGIALLKGQYSVDSAAQYSLLAIALVPILVLYAFAGKRITEGMQLGALK